MNPAWILVPVLLQVLLTWSLYIKLLVAKKAAFRDGSVDRSRTALHPDAWPDRVIQINNNIRNQFETPVLFYVLVVALIILDSVNVWSLSMASLFVAARIAHSHIHTTSNHVPTRLRLFSLGQVAILGMLIVCAHGLILSV